jgi:glycopeptide antibiotics resistance protein
MFVLVFAIEIQQAITNRGNMEFVDAIIGLWGFLALFLVYVAIAVFFIIFKLIFKKTKNKDDDVDL